MYAQAIPRKNTNGHAYEYIHKFIHIFTHTYIVMNTHESLFPSAFQDYVGLKVASETISGHLLRYPDQTVHNYDCNVIRMVSSLQNVAS